MRDRLLLIAMLLLGTLTSAIGAGDRPALLTTIPLPGVEGRFDHFALDAAGQRLFVAALGNNSVEVLDLTQNRLLRELKGFREPQGIAFAAETRRVFVGNGEGNACDVLDAGTLAPLQRVSGMEDADNVRYDAARKEVYVGYGQGALAVLDAATGKRLGEVRLKGHPESFQLEKNGPRLFVNVPGAGHVAVVDRAKRSLLATWPLRGAGSNFPMALDEPHHRLLVGCRKPARLVVLDTRTGAQTGSAEIAGDTDDLFYDAARGRVYASCGEGVLCVLRQRDADHYEVEARVPTAPGARTCYFSPERERLYLAVPHRGGQRAEIRLYSTNY